MEITFYGHSCFNVHIDGWDLLFDPFITPNEQARHIDVGDLKVDFILISHGHEDHVADVVQIAQRTGATVISNFEITTWLGAQHELTKSHPMNHGGSWQFEFGKVKYVNAVHSSTLPDGNYGGNPGGFVVETKEGTFYYAGDTALCQDMKLIPLFNQLDLAILPIGDNFTMGIEEAVIASDFVQCSQVLGVHYDTFGYIQIDHEKAIKSFANKGKTLHLMKIGETRKF